LSWYPEGAVLSDRARDFLRLEAERQSFGGDPDQDARNAADCDAWFGIPSGRILEWLGRLRRVWGLWQVSEGRLEGSLVISGAAARQLTLIGEGSGPTERWWQGDEFRVHVWDTWAMLFKNPELSKWAVWGNSAAGVEEARRFLGSCGYPA
jgi:hypothetical protein